MTRLILLERLREFTKEATCDILMPLMRQEGEEAEQYRSAEVFLMRLPDSAVAYQKAPYILHQVITGKDVQKPGQKIDASAVVRSIFCVYHNDEQEGALLLLNLMEQMRIQLLEQVVMGQQFQLDLASGLEALIYPEDTAPFYSGEMISTWHLPIVEREVKKWQ